MNLWSLIKNCDKKRRLHAQLLAHITVVQVSPTNLLALAI